MIKEDRYFVYILASKRNGTLHVGVTSNLAGRTYEHKQDLRDGFTKKYGVHRVVWFEEFGDPPSCAKSESRNGGAGGKLN